MSNAGPKYFEGVENIWLNNGMVHMHLVAMTRAAEKEEPAPRTIQELVIPLPNFVNFCEAGDHLAPSFKHKRQASVIPDASIRGQRWGKRDVSKNQFT